MGHTLLSYSLINEGSFWLLLLLWSLFIVGIWRLKGKVFPFVEWTVCSAKTTHPPRVLASQPLSSGAVTDDASLFKLLLMAQFVDSAVLLLGASLLRLLQSHILSYLPQFPSFEMTQGRRCFYWLYTILGEEEAQGKTSGSHFQSPSKGNSGVFCGGWKQQLNGLCARHIYRGRSFYLASSLRWYK